MSVRELALEALKVFNKGEYFSNMARYSKRDYLALVGAFEGIANGTITIGQGWLADLLLARQIRHGVPDYKEHQLDESEAELLKNVFASGICCSGQSFERERVSSKALTR